MQTRLEQAPLNRELCRSFNVHKTTVTLLPDGSAPSTICMSVRRDAHMPTHGLVVLPSASTPSPNLASTPSPTHPSFPSSSRARVLPINADRFSQHFTYDLARLSLEDASAPGSTLPVPFYSERGAQRVELPALALALPHPPSAALLLFFGMGLSVSPASLPPSPDTPDTPDGPSRRRSGMVGLDAHTGLFATFLLPSHVFAEFPSAPAMASALLWGNRAYPSAAHSASSSSSSEDELEDELHPDDAALRERTAFVGGLWANVLALGPRDGRIVDMVRCAWNVCREARRLQRVLS